jgi:hypothetical protein
MVPANQPPAPPSKRLARSLYNFLAMADCTAEMLRGLGWFDFLRGGLPDTDDARIVAADAVHFMLIDPNGARIQDDDSVLYAALAFVKYERRNTQQPSDLIKGLNLVLHSRPVERRSVRDWFLQAFA